MGDGTNVYLNQQPPRVKQILGYDGVKRESMCECNGDTKSVKGLLLVFYKCQELV